MQLLRGIIYLSYYSFFPVAHDEAAEVTLENELPLIEIGTMLKLRWSPESIVPILPADSYTVDIMLREYNNTCKNGCL